MKNWAAIPRPEYAIKPYFIEKAAKLYKSYLNHTNKTEKAPTKKKALNIDKNLPPCMIQLIDDGAQKGCRNNCSVLLASSLFQLEYSKEEVLEIVLSWNERNEPPLDEKEIITTVNSAQKLIDNNKGYGCSAYKSLNLCSIETCSLAQKYA
jgi:hypothetical protein